MCAWYGAKFVLRDTKMFSICTFRGVTDKDGINNNAGLGTAF